MWHQCHRSSTEVLPRCSESATETSGMRGHVGTTSSSAWWFNDAEWVHQCMTMHGPVQVDMGGTCFHRSCRVTVGTHPKGDQSSYPRLGFPEHGLYAPKALMMLTVISLFHRRLPVHCIPQHFPESQGYCRVQVPSIHVRDGGPFAYSSYAGSRKRAKESLSSVLGRRLWWCYISWTLSIRTMPDRVTPEEEVLSSAVSVFWVDRNVLAAIC